MSIKLAVALEDNKFKKHIRDRIDRSKSYICPFCNEPVISKKGQERQHHFAHAPGTNCTASEETILHFNAKHYLAYCIKQNVDIVFEVSTELLEPKLNSVLTSLNIKQYPLSLNSLANFYKKAGVYVEKSVGPYIVDVYMKHESYTYGFVFEIVVTHEMEPEKLQWLHENHVPYLEISPVSLDDCVFRKLWSVIPESISHSFRKVLVSHSGNVYPLRASQNGFL
ncbi:competence protein CoiA family protein, partial [Paenibacillus cremeus]